MKIYFVTKNDYKISEVKAYFDYCDIKSRADAELVTVKHSIQEILDDVINEIVKRKAIDAYAYLGHPCVVEHGGIFMDALPRFPGGIGQVVWNAVEDRMCSILRKEESRKATAKSVIGYCDGRRVRLYEGETPGELAEHSRGGYKCNWDPIFIPEGSKHTYGEMGPEEKRATSPAIKAWGKFLEAQFLNPKKPVTYR